ncbi:Sodium/hydrogen exchanger 4 [Apostasia shenzhenica]|uniref:Sodium/hydrogen exchanger 4 n=1 Tax=Apostasia shenzhenica TaxID=1088818 RepID=A0A2I0A727_9ASPA|nr:Sodium/hydrogen exchanger 4 [Apostasia shenzhenica]
MQFNQKIKKHNPHPEFSAPKSLVSAASFVEKSTIPEPQFRFRSSFHLRSNRIGKGREVYGEKLRDRERERESCGVQMAVDFFLSNALEHMHVVSVSIFTAVLCLCIVAGHLLGNSRWTNESAVAILMGCLAGTTILLLSRGKSSHILRFDEELFFIYLLPPIIFNAGFSVKKKQFFHNFITIMLFGVVGVFISFAIISAGSWWLFPKIGFKGLDIWDYLALGVIFSSTDTVCTLQVLHQEETPRLYSLVFGEGIVNDATSVALFNAVQKINVSKIGSRTALHVFGNFLYLFSTSTIMGIAMGLLTAFALKSFYFGRHSTDREVAIMVLMAYFSYMLAEVFCYIHLLLIL